MKKHMWSILVLMALSGFAGVQAATINYSNSNGINQNISVFDKIYSGNNTDSVLNIKFSSKNAIGFQFGLDAGKGAKVYLDGNQLFSNPHDIWWQYNWNHPQVITQLFNGLSKGPHFLSILWGENCCNGYNSGRLSTDGGLTWQALSTQNLDSLAPVPVPAAAWLFGSAIVGLMGLRRKNAINNAVSA